MKLQIAILLLYSFTALAEEKSKAPFIPNYYGCLITEGMNHMCL